MTCPFSKLGLSNVLWSAHFNSLLLWHLVLSLLLFWSEHCIQHSWHHPRLAWNATALSRGTPGSCSGAAVIEGQGDKIPLQCGRALVLGCILQFSDAPRNAVEWEKGNNHFIGLAV